jgi:APA family basic amino acid/polyamine antiporter
LLIASLVVIYIQLPGYYENLFKAEGMPMLVFFVVAIIVSIYTFLKNFSLIPVLGLLCCFYLMAQESHTNWYRFLIWLVIGLVIYFLYGRSHSRLAQRKVSM